MAAATGSTSTVFDERDFAKRTPVALRKYMIQAGQMLLAAAVDKDARQCMLNWRQASHEYTRTPGTKVKVSRFNCGLGRAAVATCALDALAALRISVGGAVGSDPSLPKPYTGIWAHDDMIITKRASAAAAGARADGVAPPPPLLPYEMQLVATRLWIDVCTDVANHFIAVIEGQCAERQGAERARGERMLELLLLFADEPHPKVTPYAPMKATAEQNAVPIAGHTCYVQQTVVATGDAYRIELPHAKRDIALVHGNHTSVLEAFWVLTHVRDAVIRQAGVWNTKERAVHKAFYSAKTSDVQHAEKFLDAGIGGKQLFAVFDRTETTLFNACLGKMHPLQDALNRVQKLIGERFASDGTLLGGSDEDGDDDDEDDDEDDDAISSSVSSSSESDDDDDDDE